MNSMQLTEKKERNSFSIQFDYFGQFRIVCQTASGEVHYSGWTIYYSIASLTVDGKTYIAGSEYGLLPKSEIVYELSAVSTTIDKSKEWLNGMTGEDMHKKQGCPFCEHGEPCSYVKKKD